MNIIEYFSAEDQEHWLARIKECEWGAAQFLCELLRDKKLKGLTGENTRLLMLTEGEKLVSFCTLAEKDDIQPTELTPWIGFVYTRPEYRGRRLMGELLRYAEELARAEGKERVYISTNHTGLYEKYGYAFYAMMKDVEGEDSRVYMKRL